MPGFSSIDDLHAEMNAGKFYSTEFVTFTNATIANAIWVRATSFSTTGTAGVATQMTKTTVGQDMQINTDVSSDKRFLTSLSLAHNFNNSTSSHPSVFILCDFLLYYPACVVTGTPTTLNNTATIPRYTTGEGVMAMICGQSALGAASPALTLTYTDDAGNTGNTSPNALTAQAASVGSGQIFAYQNTPWMPFLGADKGVRKIDSYTIASGTTGTVTFYLVKPLAMIPLSGIHVNSEKNCIFQPPFLPQVLDNACLGFIYMSGGTTTGGTAITGRASFVWG